MTLKRWSEFRWRHNGDHNLPGLSMAYLRDRQSKKVSFIFSSKLMAQIGWQWGDRVEIAYDPDSGEGLFEKSPHGWVLNRQGMKSKTASLCVSWRDEMGLPDDLDRRLALDVLEASHERVRWRLCLPAKNPPQQPKGHSPDKDVRIFL